MPNLAKAALWYAAHGFPVFPLHPRDKNPITKHGFKNATTDRERVATWWKNNPDANIGLPMGAASHLLLLDLDYRGASVVEERADVIRLFGRIPDTAEVVTGSGRHVYFRFGGGKVPRQIANGVELKGDGGYAVAPPSIHPNGNEYAFDGAAGVKALLKVADPPAWLLAAIANGGARTQKKATPAIEDQWPEGQRNNRLVSLAGGLRRSGLSVDAIAAALLEENRRRCEPPLPDAEIRRIAASVGRYPVGKERPRPLRAASVNLDALEPTLSLLNGLSVFQGQVSIASVKRRGPMIIATTADGAEIVWPSMTELGKFGPSRDLIAAATNVFLPTPPQGRIRTDWEAAVQLLLRLSAADRMTVENVLKEETRELLRLMWRQSGQVAAQTSADFIRFMRAVLHTRRDPRGQAPPSVFIAEESVWVHVSSLRAWLSTPGFTNRLYPLADIRNGLMLLGFAYMENLTRRHEGEDSETACLWRGPLEVLEA